MHPPPSRTFQGACRSAARSAMALHTPPYASVGAHTHPSGAQPRDPAPRTAVVRATRPPWPTPPDRPSEGGHRHRPPDPAAQRPPRHPRHPPRPRARDRRRGRPLGRVQLRPRSRGSRGLRILRDGSDRGRLRSRAGDRGLPCPAAAIGARTAPRPPAGRADRPGRRRPGARRHGPRGAPGRPSREGAHDPALNATLRTTQRISANLPTARNGDPNTFRTAVLARTSAPIARLARTQHGQRGEAHFRQRPANATVRDRMLHAKLSCRHSSEW